MEPVTSAGRVLEVGEVTKSFGSLTAVDRVSFAVETGQIYGIAGPNGAGKSSLFNLIAGVPYGPDRGTISFLGRQIQGLPGHSICRLGIARTFQKEVAFDSLTVEQNVAVAAGYGGGAGEPHEVVDRTLDFVDLGRRRSHSARYLPLFAKKRLMLACALATMPTLLLLDEPASGLNRMEIKEIEAFIREINRAGITIVLIEHVLPLLMAVSSRVMIMNYGQRLAEGSPAEIVADERVIEAYLGDKGRQALHGT